MALILLSSIGYSQSDSQTKPEKIKGLKVEIFFLDETAPIRGYLYEATDSSIVIIPTNSEYQLIDKDSRVEVPIAQIKKIKKALKRAVLSGAIPGFIVGALIGIAVFEGYTGHSASGEIGAALIGGIILGGLTAVAVASKKYRINGDPEKYRKKYLRKLRWKLIITEDTSLD